jgi:hypothetical protein
MIGTGDSLNVAVAGSLVLYKLAGFLQTADANVALMLAGCWAT